MSFIGTQYAEEGALDRSPKRFDQVRIAKKPDHAFVDMGYRGHGCEGDVHVHVDKQKTWTNRKEDMALDKAKGCHRTWNRSSKAGTPHGPQSIQRKATALMLFSVEPV